MTENNMKDFGWFDSLLTLSGTSLPAIKKEVREMLKEYDLRYGSEKSKRHRAYKVSSSLIRQAAFKTAGMGGLTSVPATLPGIGTIGTVLLGSAVDLYYLLRVQIELCYAISVVYETTVDEDELKAITLALLGFSGSTEALKAVAAGTFRRVIDEAAEGYIRNGLTKASSEVAERLIPRLLKNTYKIIPLLGIPLGATINIVSTLTVGRQARNYFAVLSGDELSADAPKSFNGNYAEAGGLE
ncbi:MAG: hypothetical protein HQL10_05580 [Nitrospirae bacterium]|uniref:Magnetosome protein Mad31 n=1 Tax=uncultured Nitrospirota bacterium TaxID=170969 RepID=A0A142BTV1_9BACT|nr:magnetosome protein Mad31 [uncultured Nitrospirota bacterium]MBF0328607.1 hypothetical protein [Nitrospirota bacterium]